MGFFDAVETCLKKYAVFRGRAPRSEYWWFTLFILIIYATFSMFIAPEQIHRMALLKATGVMPPQGAAHSLLDWYLTWSNSGSFCRASASSSGACMIWTNPAGGIFSSSCRWSGQS